MFNYQQIDEYQIEITSLCNAACPQCPRNNNGDGINPYMPLVSLSRDVINQAFSAELCQRIRQIFFCGSYGDPIAHPNFLDILTVHLFPSKPKILKFLHLPITVKHLFPEVFLGNGGLETATSWLETIHNRPDVHAGAFLFLFFML